ncbi:hypothetical protein BH24ACT5_BH24ACT5_21330 [soil metagenome]
MSAVVAEVQPGQVAAHELVQQFSAPIDITPDGHELVREWRGVAGATGARVESSAISVWPQTTANSRDLGVVAVGKDSTTSIVVESPAPGVLIRSIRISQLERHDGDARHRIRSEADLAGFRLVLTPVVGGQDQAPIIAVPAIAKRNALPAQLVGGSLSGESLALPDVTGTKFRITLVEGDGPEEFDRQTFSHGDVRMYAAPGPVGLHVDGPDGAELFAMSGPITALTNVDVTAALRRNLDASIDADPLRTTLTLRSDIVGSASTSWTTRGGVVERTVDSRLTVEVAGESSRIVLPPPHPGRAPDRTVADVTVIHHGMALHPISDPVPAADAGLGGPTVRDVAVVRDLPPDALRDQYLRKVAVVGWPLTPTDLSLTVLGHTVGVSGLAGPSHRADPSVVWFEFVEPVFVGASVSIAVTATRGAFGWVAHPDPMVRIAVAVTPAGERVTVGGQVIDLTGDETVVNGATLTGTDGWDIATDQFCTVSLANAVMEFSP